MDQMADGHQGMVPDHTRPSIAHHFPDPLAHLRFITMDGAVLAGGFFNSKGAFYQPLFSVVP